MWINTILQWKLTVFWASEFYNKFIYRIIRHSDLIIAHHTERMKELWAEKSRILFGVKKRAHLNISQAKNTYSFMRSVSLRLLGDDMTVKKDSQKTTQQDTVKSTPKNIPKVKRHFPFSAISQKMDKVIPSPDALPGNENCTNSGILGLYLVRGPK